MANKMTDTMMDQGATKEEIISTTIMILVLATSSFEVILVIMGKFRLADMVHWLTRILFILSSTLQQNVFGAPSYFIIASWTFIQVAIPCAQ